jgi:hypothetical protein
MPATEPTLRITPVLPLAHQGHDRVRHVIDGLDVDSVHERFLVDVEHRLILVRRDCIVDDDVRHTKLLHAGAYSALDVAGQTI